MNDLWTQAVMVMGLVVLAYYFVTLAVGLAGAQDAGGLRPS